MSLLIRSRRVLRAEISGLLSVLCLLLAAGSARAAGLDRVSWLPGEAREVSRSSSASRDTAAVEAIVAPRFSVTLGSEFALVAWQTSDFTLRGGVLALFGLESRTRSKRLFPAPGGDSNLWRGILGYEIAASFDRIASEALGKHGALELSVGYYHESDHHTASNELIAVDAIPDHPDLRGRPEIGNYLSADFASRFALGPLMVILRQQAKLFVNGAATPALPFRAGTSTEVTLQLHQALGAAIPFLATAGEELFATERPSVRNVRSQLGVALPGLSGELRLYASYDAGAERGLLITEQQHTFGGGFRYVPFAPVWR